MEDSVNENDKEPCQSNGASDSDSEEEQVIPFQSRKRKPMWPMEVLKDCLRAEIIAKKAKQGLEVDPTDPVYQGLFDNCPSTSRVQVKEEPNENNEATTTKETVKAVTTEDPATTTAESAETTTDEAATTTQEAAVTSEAPETTTQAAEHDSTNSAGAIKSEPEDEYENTSNDDVPSTSGVVNPSDIKPTVKVEKADASSTTRPCCKFGIRCYRRNPMHRTEEAHPGDQDYRRPSFPSPPPGTPMCPYGDKCYRRNPAHFEQFDHPPETDFAANYKNYRMRLRRRKAKQAAASNGSDSEDSLSDAFADGSDSDPDYDPSNDGNDDDDDKLLSDCDDGTPVDA